MLILFEEKILFVFLYDFLLVEKEIDNHTQLFSNYEETGFDSV